MSYREALEALKKGKYKDVIDWFEGLPPAGRDGKTYALAALAHFKSEEYLDAEKLYAEAVTAGGTGATDWRKMQALAKANDTAKIDVDVPGPELFDLGKLLAPPPVRDGDLPGIARDRAQPGCFRRLRLFLGDVLGVVLTVVIEWVIEWVGQEFGYHAKIWTNWYRRPWTVGVLLLAYIREELNAHNLTSTYPRGRLVGFQKVGQRAPLGVTHFRTADGSWNNLSDPKEGAAGTRFLRNVDLSATCPETDPRCLNRTRARSAASCSRARSIAMADRRWSPSNSSICWPLRGSSS